MPLSRKVQEEVNKQKKLADFRADIEKAAKELSAKTDAIAELNRLIREQENNLIALNGRRAELEIAIVEFENYRKELDERITRRRDEEDDAAKQLDATRKALSEAHTELVKVEGALTESKALVDERNHDAAHLEDEITALRKEKTELSEAIVSARNAAKEEIRQLNDQREEVQELLERNEKVSTSITNDLAKLESYVKRLQRFYDQHGINLDVLSEFGIPKRTHHE